MTLPSQMSLPQPRHEGDFTGSLGHSLRVQTSNDIVLTLKRSGHRITRARAALADIFSATSGPISATELIRELGKRKLKVNKTTVYRELDFLQKERMIQELDLLDGKKRYEILNPKSHHHHLVCRECNAIKCIELPNDLKLLLRRIAREHQFLIESHVLEFFGLCKQCEPGSLGSR